MQTVTTTPAESLLSRLLQSEKFRNTYHYYLEKKEGHTSLTVSSTEFKNDIKRQREMP